MRRTAPWLIFATLSMATALGNVGVAGAAQSIGSATNVVRDVTGKIEGAERKLALKDEVHGNELISTAEKSAAELRFLDDTKVTLGPNTKLVLDRYVFDPEKSTSSVKMTVAEGVFRVVTGKSKFGSFSIKTPTATIGIRGTVIDIVVAKDGTTVVLMHSDSFATVKGFGTVRGGATAGRIGGGTGICSVLDEPNTATTVLRDGSTTPAGDAPEWATAKLSEVDTLLGDR